MIEDVFKFCQFPIHFTYISPAIYFIKRHQHPYPFGLMMSGRSWSEGYRFGFNGQEQDDEVYGEGILNTALYWEYDTRLGRRWNIDPVVNHSLSPFVVFDNNPIYFIDPNGASATDYIDLRTGEHLEHVDDGIDEALAIDRTIFNALKEDGELSNQTAQEVGAYSLGKYSDFNTLASSIYGEMDWKSNNPDFREGAGMYEVLRNRSLDKNTDVLTELKRPNQVFGYDPDNPKSNYNYALNRVPGKYNEARLNAAFKGVMLASLNFTNYSNSAKGWDGHDLKVVGSKAYRDRYLVGFLFSDPSHDIFKMGSHLNDGKYTYKSTAAFGGTVFNKEY